MSLAATLRWFSSKRNFIFIEFYPGDSTRWWDETGLVSELISTPSLPTQQMKGCTTSSWSTPPTLYEQQCGFFYVSQESEQYKSCEMRPKVFRSYPRRLECLTICRCPNKGSRRPWVFVRPGFEPSTSSQQTGAYLIELIGRRLETSATIQAGATIQARSKCSTLKIPNE